MDGTSAAGVNSGRGWQQGQLLLSRETAATHTWVGTQLVNNHIKGALCKQTPCVVYLLQQDAVQCCCLHHLWCKIASYLCR